MNRRTASPFWRNRTANGRSNLLKSSDTNLVIGASYSHADILKFDSLYAPLAHFDRCPLNKIRSLTPSSSRPHTPPSSGKANTRNVRSPPLAANAALSSPPKKSNHSQLLSSTTSDWEDDVDDEEEEETNVSGYTYDDGLEEDEFGLPSISSMKREARKRPPAKQFNDPGGGIGSSMNGALYNLDPPRLSGRGRANSSDIALERGPLSYPAAKKADRKILRPQYKDILRGMQASSLCSGPADIFRPSQFPTPDFAPADICKCESQRNGSSNDPYIPYQQIQKDPAGH